MGWVARGKTGTAGCCGLVGGPWMGCDAQKPCLVLSCSLPMNVVAEARRSATTVAGNWGSRPGEGGIMLVGSFTNMLHMHIHHS